ncbi:MULTISPECIES: hypothetical protein [Flavobacteriaceae]|uniref:hypothetical protein n=1 Tax=Flavobacteriaceae TaxID=49546 RepID=UPI003A9526E5
MSTTKTPSKAKQNGAVKNDAPKVEKSTTKIDEVLKPTAESRLKKLENFKILAERHKFLEQKNDDLQKFIVSSDGMKEKLVLKNAQGFSFEVSNSQVLEKCLYVIKEELQKITTASEKEVLNFQI